MGTFKKLLLTVLFLLAPFCLAARLSVRAGADRSGIYIGDPVHFYILIEHDSDSELLLPPPGQELGPFEILEYSVTNLEIPGANTVRKAIRYKIAAYFLGQAEIPSVKITCRDRTGKEESAATEPIALTVAPVPKQEGDTDDIRDLKKQIYLPDPFWLIFILSLLLAGTAAWIIFRYFRKRSAASVQPPPAVQQSEDEEALEKIRSLVAKNYPEQGRIKLYYSELCEIVRYYLFRRFGIPTLERTSYEIMRDLRNIHGKNETEGFASFFEQTDMVKFARYVPSAQEVREITAAAVQLIRKTGKKEEAAIEVL